MQTIPAGATTAVALAQSNVLAVCTPPQQFHPNPTTWHVNPSSVTLGATTADTPVAGQTVLVTVPASHSPHQTITISWSGNTTCTSYNGHVSLRVSAPGSGPTGCPARAGAGWKAGGSGLRAGPAQAPCPSDPKPIEIQCLDALDGGVGEAVDADRRLRLELAGLEREFDRAMARGEPKVARATLALIRHAINSHVDRVRRERGLPVEVDVLCRQQSFQIPAGYRRLIGLMIARIELEEVLTLAEGRRVGLRISALVFELACQALKLKTGVCEAVGFAVDLDGRALVQETKRAIRELDERIRRERKRLGNQSAAVPAGRAILDGRLARSPSRAAAVGARGGPAIPAATGRASRSRARHRAIRAWVAGERRMVAAMRSFRRALAAGKLGAGRRAAGVVVSHARAQPRRRAAAMRALRRTPGARGRISAGLVRRAARRLTRGGRKLRYPTAELRGKRLASVVVQPGEDELSRRIAATYGTLRNALSGARHARAAECQPCGLAAAPPATMLTASR